MTIILNAFGAVLLGALGWFALEFVGRPVRSFFDLRRRAKAEMIRLKGEQVSAGFSYDKRTNEKFDDRLHQVQSALKSVAAELISFEQTEWAAAYLVTFMGYAPIEAGERLIEAADRFGEGLDDMNFLAVSQALKI